MHKEIERGVYKSASRGRRPAGAARSLASTSLEVTDGTKAEMSPPRPHVLRARTLVGAALPAQNTHSSGKCGTMLRATGAATGVRLSCEMWRQFSTTRTMEASMAYAKKSLMTCRCREGRSRQHKAQRTTRGASKAGKSRSPEKRLRNASWPPSPHNRSRESGSRLMRRPSTWRRGAAARTRGRRRCRTSTCARRG